MIYIALVILGIMGGSLLWLGILLHNGRDYSTRREEEADVLTFSIVGE